MVKQVLQETDIPYMLVSADNIDHTNTAWIGEMWATARARMKVAQAKEYLLVIDEVHKIDNWSEAVKKEWDEDTFKDLNMKVVILGSSRLLLKDGLTESLAGDIHLDRSDAKLLQLLHFLYPACCAINLVALLGQTLCGGETDTAACSCDKNDFHLTIYDLQFISRREVTTTSANRGVPKIRWPYFRWKQPLRTGGGRESLWFDNAFISHFGLITHSILSFPTSTERMPPGLLQWSLSGG